MSLGLKQEMKKVPSLWTEDKQ